MVRDEIWQRVLGTDCKHEWKIFNDTNEKGKGTLTFYCKGCLKLAKTKKEYFYDYTIKKEKK